MADEHLEPLRANLIECEACNESFFFDLLRHPRYFVTHFKTCHLKNVLYRVNGCSDDENQRVRFGPRRKKEAMAWFRQLKSTEKRMISMQDNKWGEITERECWACRVYVLDASLCKQARLGSEVPHAFEPTERGRRQALVHLRQAHEGVYTALVARVPAARPTTAHPRVPCVPLSVPQFGHASGTHHVSVEAERSRLRRKRATPDAKRAEAARSKRRRDQMTPAQRHEDAERRARKRQQTEERRGRRARCALATPDVRAREKQRSRARRQQATEHQRQREAQRSRVRRLNATEEQRQRERERGRRRYALRKQHARPVPPDAPERGTQAATEGVARASNGTCGLPAPRGSVVPTELVRRNQQLVQQQAGLGVQLRSLWASLSLPQGAREQA